MRTTDGHIFEYYCNYLCLLCDRWKRLIKYILRKHKEKTEWKRKRSVETVRSLIPKRQSQAERGTFA